MKCSVRVLVASLALPLGLPLGLNAAPLPAPPPYQWTNVEIVGGGFVDGIDFSPKQAGLVYARTDIGGAYRWNPAKRRWVPLTDFVSGAESNLLGTESIGVDPADPNRVYLAQGEYTQGWASNGAILRSSNQGRSWQRTDMPFKMGSNEDGRSIGERLCVDPNQDRVLYFGSRRSGLWRSADYGATWAQVASFPVPTDPRGIGIGFVVFDVAHGTANSPTRTLYVSAANSPTPLYVSRDAGSTWAAVAGQPTGLVPHHGVLTPAGMLYVTYGDAPGPNGMTSGAVWKYDTRIGAWTDITPLRPGSAGNGSFGYAGLAVDARHPETVMVSTMDWWTRHDDLFRSTDGGAHWTGLKAAAVEDTSGAPYLHTDDKTPALGHWMGALAIDPFQSGHVLFGTGATIWGSDDVTNGDTALPTHWTVRAQGLEETAVTDLASPPVGAHLLSAMGDIGGFRHDSLTAPPAQGNFQNPYFNTTQSLDFAALAPNIVVRTGTTWVKGATRGAISRDGGAHWAPFGSDPAGSGGMGHAALSADGAAIVWKPDKSVLSYSHDAGATWTACTGLPGGLTPIADRVNARKFYALDTQSGTFWASTDGGARFQASAASLPPGSGKARAVPGYEGDLWITSRSGLYHTTDAGAHFAQAGHVQACDVIGYGKVAPGQTYPALYLVGTVGGIYGVFRSDDAGADWVRINDDAHQYGWIGQAITGDPRVYGRVFVATNGRGIIMGEPAPSALP